MGRLSIQRENFWSQSSPLSALHATPALRAAGVSRSSHLLRAIQTCVAEVSVATSGPGRPALSSLPLGRVGSIGPSMPSSWPGTCRRGVGAP
jgi:hypothetical protein